MRRRPLLLTRALLCAAALTAPLVAAPAAAAPAPDEVQEVAPGAVHVALIADTPYGKGQLKKFPDLVRDINADGDVRMVLHGGDVKSGGQRCGDAELQEMRVLFDTFADPFVLTPGDNEWTDCHRPAAGRYVPTERLEAVRRTFYPERGRTLGQRTATVRSQAGGTAFPAYVENVRWTRAGVVFATVHVVGSGNGLAPWSGLRGGDRRQERLDEVTSREAAALAWVDTVFDRAVASGAPGVLLLLQAEPVDEPGYSAVRDRIVARSRAFGRPVLLAHGDEHAYEQEPAYAGVPNLTRLETYGATTRSWLELRVDPADPRVFSWEPHRVRG